MLIGKTTKKLYLATIIFFVNISEPDCICIMYTPFAQLLASICVVLFKVFNVFITLPSIDVMIIFELILVFM